MLPPQSKGKGIPKRSRLESVVENFKSEWMNWLAANPGLREEWPIK